jgi:hypothetical protein
VAQVAEQDSKLQRLSALEGGGDLVVWIFLLRGRSYKSGVAVWLPTVEHPRHEKSLKSKTKGVSKWLLRCPNAESLYSRELSIRT